MILTGFMTFLEDIAVPAYSVQDLPKHQLMYSSSEIAVAVNSIAQALNESRYLGKTFPLIVPILEGGSVFCHALVKKLTFPFEVRSAKLESYKGRVRDSGINLKLFPTPYLKGRVIIFVDDICDSGDTLRFCYDHSSAHGAQAVKSITLLRRQDSIFIPDFYGFTVPKDKWVFGYGMDYADNQLRNLPDIHALC